MLTHKIRETYKALGAVIGGALDLRSPDGSWDEVLRMAASINAGTVAPSTILRRPPPRAVPDLMEAFRKSLTAVQAETANDDGKPAKTAKPKKPKAKVEGQREMLLPIAGGKTEAEAKPAKAPRRKAG